MRLHISKASAEEQVVALINEGYKIYEWIVQDYTEKSKLGNFDSNKDNQVYEERAQEWANRVIRTLNLIFPTELVLWKISSSILP